MSKPWIKDLGTGIDEENISSVITEWYDKHTQAITLAYYTDRFVSYPAGNTEAGKPEDVKLLLELRSFTPDAELWIHRSNIGDKFSWRVADDEYLREQLKQNTTNFLKTPSDVDNYRKEITQKLDVDLAYTIPELTQEGCRLLKTIGGRLYALPIKDENAVKLFAYMDYDENGICKIRDFRVAGFVSVDSFKGGM